MSEPLGPPLGATEQEWFKNVYQGDRVPQLTFRAVLMGSVLGAFMSLSNLYIGLKTGWALGVAITACILSFAIYRSLMAIFPRWFPTEMTILENNCMQSTASSAGYSTGGTMVAGVAAYLLITGKHIPWPILTAWTFFLAALGVFIAIPMKRQMINVEQLKFPSGIAAAETLRSLYSKGQDAMVKARALGAGAFVGSVITWFRDAGKPFAIPGHIAFPGSLNGAPLAKWTIQLDMSLIMVAAGAIMGWRVAWSMLLGGVINYFFLAPQMARLGAIDMNNLGYRAIVSWSTWAGSSLMVTASLLLFALQWRTIFKAFGGLGSIFGGEKRENTDPLSRIEVPPHWFLGGSILSGLGCIALLYFYFGTTLWMGVVAVVMAFVLSVVACRVTGESDTTPMGAMGKITQLLFGVLAPSNLVTNLMTAGVTAGAAASSADLMTDLKSGYVLGANPRKQFIAQFLGIFAGTAIIVPAFYWLVPDASVLGTDKWPAPAAQVWAAVAKLLSSGLQALHPTARMGIIFGALVGIVLPLIELSLPRYKKWIPSSTGLGLALVIPFFNTFSIFLGALITLVMEKKTPVQAERYIIPVASGIIAGESLLGVLVALLSASGVI